MKDIAAAGTGAGKVTPNGTSLRDAAPTDSDADVRARPGRRTVEERQQAVLDLLAGKATVEPVARRLGVQAATVEGWRQDALGGIAEALRRGSGKRPGELELERKDRDLEKVVSWCPAKRCWMGIEFSGS